MKINYRLVFFALLVVGISACQSIDSKQSYSTAEIFQKYANAAELQVSKNIPDLPEGQFVVPESATKGQLRSFLGSYFALNDRIIETKDQKLVVYDTSRLKTFWLTDVQKGFEEATEKNRPILMKFTAGWCSPCKFQKTLFYTMQHSKVSMINKFVLIEIDYDFIDDSTRKFLDAHKLLPEKISLPRIVLVSPDMKTKTVMHGFKPEAELYETAFTKFTLYQWTERNKISL